jgi:hypothetical protein
MKKPKRNQKVKIHGSGESNPAQARAPVLPRRNTLIGSLMGQLLRRAAFGISHPSRLVYAGLTWHKAR